jgi:hypothetical protein
MRILRKLSVAGDTIWVRGGTHTITMQLVLSESGTSDSSRFGPTGLGFSGILQQQSEDASGFDWRA